MDAAPTAYLKNQINFEFDRFKRRAAPPQEFTALPDIPAGRYTDDAFFELEQANIWSRAWLLAGTCG